MGAEKRKVSVVEDLDGKKVVIIHDILFYGKQNIEWESVEQYLKQYVGEFFDVIETGDRIFVGSDFPDEYANANDTATIKGARSKAKANASQGIPEIVEIATKRQFKENKNEKHSNNAKFGWYRYTTRFGIPIYADKGELLRYNVFNAELLVRHQADGRLFLYDLVNIKKEAEYPA